MQQPTKEKLESNAKLRSVPEQAPRASYAIPIAVYNESVDIVAYGTVTLRRQSTDETVPVPIGRILPGGKFETIGYMTTGFPDVVSSFFKCENRPNSDWSTLNVSATGGFEEVNIHLQN